MPGLNPEKTPFEEDAQALTFEQLFDMIKGSTGFTLDQLMTQIADCQDKGENFDIIHGNTKYYVALAEINKFFESHERPKKAMTVYSPTTGYVVHKNAVEGAKVKPESTLFRIVDLSTVWIQADVYEYEVPWLEVGQNAELSLSYVSGKTFRGKVSYIYPYLEESSRTIRVRLEFGRSSLWPLSQ